jgi:vacuolar-type H+-ATPase subunit C/Vma6
MKNDAEILFQRLKDVAIRNPYRSEKFKKFVKELNDTPHYDFHHVFESIGSIKSTDLLGVAEEHFRHLEAHNEREKIIALMPRAVENLIKYVIHLEQELKGKNGAGNSNVRAEN